MWTLWNLKSLSLNTWSGVTRAHFGDKSWHKIYAHSINLWTSHQFQDEHTLSLEQDPNSTPSNNPN